VKIDADREERLVRSLGIESYPTLVLASAEGKVLGRQVGYADATQIMGLLGKAPAQPEKSPTQTPIGSTPEVSVAAAALARARGEYEAGHYAECLRQSNSIKAMHPSTSEALEAQRLTQRIASDPNASRLLKEQINANLATLQPQIAAALER